MKKTARKYFWPGLGIAIAVYFSAIFAIGAVAGFAVAETFMRKLVGPGKVKMIKLDYKNWELHLHHWIWPGVIIVIAAMVSTVGIIPIFILGFLNGLIFHDIYTDKKWRTDEKKWYQVIYKVKNPA
jgi:hypothetical protein